jgi:hypothetical protein
MTEQNELVVCCLETLAGFPLSLSRRVDSLSPHELQLRPLFLTGWALLLLFDLLHVFNNHSRRILVCFALHLSDGTPVPKKGFLIGFVAYYPARNCRCRDRTLPTAGPSSSSCSRWLSPNLLFMALIHGVPED